MKLSSKLICFVLFFVLFKSICFSQSVTKDLSTLSRQFTGRFLQNGYVQADIDAFLNFISANKIESAFYIYTFKDGAWTAKPIVEKRKDSYPHTRFATELLEWLSEHLKKNIKDGTAFIYMPQEPFHECGFLDTDKQLELARLFEKCPILLTCTHPKIMWTEKAILIPDPYILHKNYKKKVKKINDEGILIFKEKKPSIFFRGALTGVHSYVYTMKSIEKDERLKLFLLGKRKSFVDARITDHSALDIAYRVVPEFKEWFFENLTSQKGEPADFVEHACYKYLISIDGYGSAWSRVPYILFTGSVLLLRADCKQYFYKLLVDGKTHIALDPGLTNLSNAYYMLEENPLIAESLANEGRAFAQKYLTPKALNIYLSQVIHDLSNAFNKS